jgi:AcrR family transcriptional regulator
VLNAARSHFAHDGYDGTTIRGIAAAAGVDPALVMQFFGSKEGLFAAVLRDYADVDDNLHAAFTGAVAGRGERFTRAYLAPWEHPIRGQSLRSLVRATIGSPRAVGPFHAELKASLSRSGIPRPLRSRYLLALSQLFGIAIARHILEVPELVAMSADDIVKLMAPALDVQLGERAGRSKPSR